MAKRRNLTASLLALATTLGLASPSLAQNYSDIEALINTWLSSRLTTDLAPSQSTVQANLNARRSQLETQINAEVANGRLTEAEAIALRAELATLNTQLSTDISDGGGLTIGEVRDLLTSLRTLALHIQAEASDSDTVAGGSTTTPTTDVLVRINDLRTRIDTARRLGQVPRNAANRMNASLNFIRAQHNRFSRDGLTAAEISTLNSYLATVETRFNSYGSIGATPDPAINARIAQLRSSISTALNRREITRREYNDLNSSINWIASRHTAMLADGLTAAEKASLEAYLLTVTDRLASWSEVAVTPSVNMTTDFARVRARIDTAVSRGDLSWSESQRLYRDLDYVERMHTNMVSSGGTLTNEEVSYLRRMLSSVERGVDIYM